VSPASSENMSAFTCDHGKTYEIFGSGGGQRLADEIGVPLVGRCRSMREWLPAVMPARLSHWTSRPARRVSLPSRSAL